MLRAGPAWVEFRTPDGTPARATHGDIVGRMSTAAVQIDDPAVSEAHALVSLRAGAFRLLALRGQLAVMGQLVKECTLAPGVDVQVTPNLHLTVRRVQLPRAVLAIEGPRIPRQAIPASCSIATRPSPMLTPGFRPDADAWIWTNGNGWALRVGSERARPLLADDDFEVGGVGFRTSLLPLDSMGAAATLGPCLDLEPLVLVPNFDVVDIFREGAERVTISGRPARIVCELIALGGTASWDVLASEIWPGEAPPNLRRKLDVNMARLRDKLRARGLRPDLVRPCGNGVLQLVLHERDRVESS